MSGHSKWHSIKHAKGAADAARGKRSRASPARSRLRRATAVVTSKPTRRCAR